MAKLCFNRHDDGAFLQTCLKPANHPGIHEGDNGLKWADAEGWWDIYGDQPEKARQCGCERYVVGLGNKCSVCINEEIDAQERAQRGPPPPAEEPEDNEF